MTEPLRILESAYKHGITEQEILFVLDHKNPTRRSYIMHDDNEGNAQDMFIAHTGTRPWPIEVGISYRVDESIVFHASKLTPEFQNMYETEP